MNPKDLLSNAVSWPFLQEPIWRWLVFIVVLGFLLSAWNGVLRHMKDVIT